MLKWLESAIERFCLEIVVLQNNCFSKLDVLKEHWSKFLRNPCEAVHLSLLKMNLFRKSFPAFRLEEENSSIVEQFFAKYLCLQHLFFLELWITGSVLVATS